MSLPVYPEFGWRSLDELSKDELQTHLAGAVEESKQLAARAELMEAFHEEECRRLVDTISGLEHDLEEILENMGPLKLEEIFGEITAGRPTRDLSFWQAFSMRIKEEVRP